MLEFLFELLGEFLLQAVLEALAELGLHALAEPFRRPPSPGLAALGYTLFGAAAGGLSLLAWPHHLVASEAWQLANLVVTPLLAGGLMSLMGAWRARRGQAVLRIDRFAYGWLFAMALALVRFCFAQ